MLYLTGKLTSYVDLSKCDGHKTKKRKCGYNKDWYPGSRSSQLSEIGPLDFQVHVIYVEMKLETQILVFVKLNAKSLT